MTTTHESLPAPTPPRARGFLHRYWKVLVPVGLVVTGVVAWLAFGLFGVQYIFIDDRVDEAGPVFASGAGAAPAPTPAAPGTTAAPTTAAPGTTAAPATTSPPSTAAPATTAPTTTAPVVTTVAIGQFIDRSHPTRGTASVLTDGTDQRFLRFEDFETDNGPDLDVYLVPASADSHAEVFDDDFVDLGTLKGNVGAQNYEIPPEVDLDRYSTVVIWCTRFAVAFGAADLA